LDSVLKNLTQQIKAWGVALGLDAVGIADTELSEAESRLNHWLAKQHHGEMAYMAKHGIKRSRPEELESGTLRIISARLNYLPEPICEAQQILDTPQKAYISRYTLGRDYHKVLRKKLQKLAQKIEHSVSGAQFRVFVDSAPVLEKPLAQKAGLGWIGKHTNLIAKDAGSWFFLGEIYTNIPLICDQPSKNHCGSCQACLDACPTQAIIAPYQLDARRCISYLTIELKGAIPVPFRALMGNRIIGCDDCQQVCPWNRFAQLTQEHDFLARACLDSSDLIELFKWDEETFLKQTEGSAIRRIGHQRWLRNIAVALGNVPTSPKVVMALQDSLNQSSPLVLEHVRWALEQHHK
jgi:epoxyqueuosine reductase